MGHKPPPPRVNPIRIVPGASEIQEERLDYLREMVARGYISYEEHADAVDQVLAGKQPVLPLGVGEPLPFMPDPELYVLLDDL